MSELNGLLQRLSDAGIDFVVVGGVGNFEQVRASAVEVNLFGRRVRVIGLEQLIKAKEALGRQKDLLAVMELRAIASKEF